MLLTAKPKNLGWVRSRLAPLAVVFLALSVTGCAATLVQPYDEKLFNDTGAFFKKAAAVVDEGKKLSPKTDEDRAEIEMPATHAAHFSVFEGKYDGLIIDVEALILRAMSKSEAVNSAGQAMQGKITALIDAALPSNCLALQAEFSAVSLTVGNYVDLKCLIVRWRDQHQDARLTRDTRILKRANWEARKSVLFQMILAIQKAEAFKNAK